jgi:hypothetical protein
MAFVGQTRSRRLIAELRSLGFGEMTMPDEFPPRRTPYVLDNGAFKAWKAGAAFDGEALVDALTRAANDNVRPLWTVAPDVVAGGLDSLRLSTAWLPRLAHLAPTYLVVQDGMRPEDVAAALAGFAGVFVGGSLSWKLATGAGWCEFAHARALPCHIGRVGTARRVAWAKRAGATSIDSSLPLWSRENLRAFVAAVGSRQLELPGAA